MGHSCLLQSWCLLLLYTYRGGPVRSTKGKYWYALRGRSGWNWVNRLVSHLLGPRCLTVWDPGSCALTRPPVCPSYLWVVNPDIPPGLQFSLCTCTCNMRPSLPIHLVLNVYHVYWFLILINIRNNQLCLIKLYSPTKSMCQCHGATN